MAVNLIFNLTIRKALDLRIKYEDLAKNSGEENMRSASLWTMMIPSSLLEGMVSLISRMMYMGVLFHILEQNFLPERVNFTIGK